MRPILLEVIAPMLSTVEMSCRGCSLIFGSLGIKSKYRTGCASEYPEDWKQAVDLLSNRIGEISSLYRHRVRIKVIDAQSPLGIWKQIRYRVFKFPAFVVDRHRSYIGWDSNELQTLIDERIHKSINARS